MQASIVIPAYEPEKNFLDFLTDLINQTDRPVIVVDDGSGLAYKEVFQQAKCKGALLLTHPHNLGKGAALKTAMLFQMNNLATAAGLVTADSDGQHQVADILKFARLVEQQPETLFLGIRQFNEEHVPFKSRYGNKLTAMMFHFSTGIMLQDTQTGLRGIPQTYLPQLLTIEGQRFDYEMNMLIQIAERRLQIVEVPIATIYFGKNEHSHFRTFQDSFLVYAPFLKFIGSSGLSALFDIAFFTILFHFLPNDLFLSTVIARISSGCINYQLNRQLVFKTTGKKSVEAGKYALLFISQMLFSYLLIRGLSVICSQIVMLKLTIDLLLFFLSFYLQRKIVFKSKEEVKFD